MHEVLCKGHENKGKNKNCTWIASCTYTVFQFPKFNNIYPCLLWLDRLADLRSITINCKIHKFSDLRWLRINLGF